MEMLLDVRFGYGADAPLIEMTRDGDALFMAGPGRARSCAGPWRCRRTGGRVSAHAAA